MRYYYIILALFFVACSSKTKKTVSAFTQLHLTSDTAVVKQNITLNAALSSVVSLPSDHKLEVPPGSLVYEDGSPVNEPVELQIKEYRNYLSMLSKGLQTISKEGILESKGMYYIEAKTASGKKVRINPDNPLILIGKLSGKEDGFDMYEGLETDTGIIWTNPVPAFKAGAIHFAALVYYYKIEGASYYDNSEYDKRMLEGVFTNMLDYIMKEFDLIKYQNTMVASPAFVERFFHFMYCYGHLTSEDISNKYLMQSSLTEDFKINMMPYVGKFLQSLPLENMTLKELDDKILERLVQDSAYSEKYFKQKYGNGLYDGPGEKIYWIQKYRDYFCKPSSYDKFDFIQKIEIDTATLKDMMINGYNPDNYSHKKGLPPRMLIVIENKDIFKQSFNLAYGRKIYSQLFKYPLSTLGWLNIDKLLTDGLEEVSIKVKLNTDNINTSVALLLTKKKVVIYSNVEKGKYVFNAKLPLENAVIMATTITNNIPYFAQKQILIGRDTAVQLDLQPSSKEAIKAALEAIEAGYTK